MAISGKSRRDSSALTSARSRQAKTAPLRVFSIISDARLRELYARMLQRRILDEQVRQWRRQGRLPGKHRSTIGGEAFTTAATLDLRAGDWLLPHDPVWTVGLLRGLPLVEILVQVQETARASRTEPPPAAKRGARNILPPAADVAAQIYVAAGAAMAARERKAGSVVVAFCGKDSLSSRASRQALEYVGAQLLPILFVVQRDAATTAVTIANDPVAIPFPVIPVDGTDAVALYRVAHESMHKARHGGGPTLIEAVRDGGDQRSEADPLDKMEAYLAGKGLFSESWKQRLVDRFIVALDLAIHSDPPGTAVGLN